MEHSSELELAIDACADRLDFLNQTFSSLATPTTLRGVELWRQCRIKSPVTQSEALLQTEEQQPAVDLKSIAIGLLTKHSLEDVLDLLAANYSSEMTLPELIHLIGRQQYLIALKRELNELLKNAISFEQIATLWNDLGRPSFGSPTWTSRAISLLAS
jgi:hypothetical protein